MRTSFTFLIILCIVGAGEFHRRKYINDDMPPAVHAFFEHFKRTSSLQLVVAGYAGRQEGVIPKQK